MGCNNFLTEEDDRLLAESEGKACQLDPEIQAQIERDMPAVERAIAERCVECLEENVENGKNELTEKLVQEERESTDLEKLDLELKPTEKEYQETYKIGKEIGMEGWEIGNYPMIIGIKDPETLERIPDMENRIKEEMINLHNSKLSPRFRDAEVADRIMLIDKDEPSEQEGKGIAGDVLKKGYFERPELSRVVHVFRDPDTGKLPEEQRAHWVVIHEICHLNMFKEREGEASEFEKVFTDHHDEWISVCNAQLDRPGPASPYAGEQLPKEGPREFGFLNPEFIAEHVAAWDTDLAEVCSEMKEFFDRYFKG